MMTIETRKNRILTVGVTNNIGYCLFSGQMLYNKKKKHFLTITLEQY